LPAEQPSPLRAIPLGLWRQTAENRLFRRAPFNPLTLTCRAVLFDMDGTLVDSTGVVERAWNRWAKRHAISLEAVLSFSHGRPTIATMERFLPGRDHAQELDEMDSYEETELEGIVAVPGAMQVVGALRNHPWAIVTSARRTLAEARVTAAGLPLPKVIVPADEILGSTTRGVPGI